MIDEIEPRSYTWTHAARDLALLTPATLHDLTTLTARLEPTGVSPYDAVPLLERLLRSPTDDGWLEALADLLTLAQNVCA